MATRGWTALLICALAVPLAAPVNAAETVVFDLGERHSLSSKAVGLELPLVVRVPTGAAAGRPLPVLYVVGAEWRARFAELVATTEVLVAGDSAPPMIVVGIDLPDGNGVLVPKSTLGDGAGPDAYLRMLVDELFPFVEKQWKAAPYRIVYGGSNSGLFALWALLNRPDAVNAAIASSPMVGWCPEAMKQLLSEQREEKSPGERRLALVWSDNDYSRVVQGLPGFLDGLRGGAPSWLKWSATELEGLGHVPPGDLSVGLHTVFPDWAPAPSLATADEVVAHYHGLQKRYGFPVPVAPGPLFDRGFKAFQETRLDEARKLFAAAADAAPDDARGFAGLALVAQANGDLEEAKTWASKGVAAEPGSTLAQRVLARVSNQEK